MARERKSKEGLHAGHTVYLVIGVELVVLDEELTDGVVDGVPLDLCETVVDRDALAESIDSLRLKPALAQRELDDVAANTHLLQKTHTRNDAGGEQPPRTTKQASESKAYENVVEGGAG
jgi:hypothetical protein